ncbi:MAG TPA: hypothetical protein VH062_23400 [Polyangiaceae bacterium]|jgi:hypothetical protein|nr:hypothetical protein [Polyangiaceae bacterium]
MLPSHTRLVGALTLLALPAHAAEPPPVVSSSTSYALPLGLSYAVLPVIATASAIFLPNANDTEAALLVTGVVTAGLAAPIVVHAVHGQPTRAVVSPFGAVGGALVLGLVGLGIGELRRSAMCTASSVSSDGCDVSAVWPPVIIGAATGYVAWAVFDVIENSTTGPGARGSSGVALVARIDHGFFGVSVLGSL